MLILHPFTGLRPEDEKETWDFLKDLQTMLLMREKVGLGHDEIIHRKMGVEKGFPRSAYVDFIREFWGSSDMVVVEEDKVPTLENYLELISCKRDDCCFPYPMLGLAECDMDYWREIRPNTLGFVKFSKASQLALPPEQWGKDIDKPAIYPFAPVDKMIEEPLTAKLGPMHLHETPIKHNHRRQR